ncbi:hemerythrin domain-containing protein [Cupriavidus numazuensis]|uniref:Bacteriohemerythrin n=1 Tax=Cupriavidus numazuensis TaxID=221992 RepID=A0ABN7Q707_9BURK|nr:hemerythrin domain-containing protein [Cupriavidus numazuensis]CAG2158927.1 Bacteriohemerythrin [Cupriavidus numazuensis]
MTDSAVDQASLEWCDRLKLGHPPMDETHEEFVAIVNAMLNCSDDELKHHLAEFAIHAETHFSQELLWMQTTAFPSMDCHVREHEAVMQSVREVQALLADGGSLLVARRLAAELARWFPAHADYLDSALAHWIVKERFGGAPVVLRRMMQSPT